MKAYKVIFLGDQSVGKTSLITRFLYGAFENLYSATIGIDFVSKVVALSDRSIKLQLWDTAGQERFRSLIPSYLRDTSGCVVVYDITSRKSFESVEGWVAEVKRERQNVIIALVGNKADMADSAREVSEQEGQDLATKLELPIFKETSAKSGANVTQIFTEVAAALPNPTEKRQAEPEVQLDTKTAKVDKSKCAC
jgi:small GTP-binding protein